MKVADFQKKVKRTIISEWRWTGLAGLYDADRVPHLTSRLASLIHHNNHTCSSTAFSTYSVVEIVPIGIYIYTVSRQIYCSLSVLVIFKVPSSNLSGLSKFFRYYVLWGHLKHPTSLCWYLRQNFNSKTLLNFYALWSCCYLRLLTVRSLLDVF